MLTRTYTVNIPPEYQNIKERIFENVDGKTEDKNKLIDSIGISAAVKTMVYTDAIDEDDKTSPCRERALQ